MVPFVILRLFTDIILALWEVQLYKFYIRDYSQ